MSKNLHGCVPEHPTNITPEWLTDRMYAANVLASGSVVSVSVELGAMWNVAHTARLKIDYSENVSSSAPAHVFVKIAAPDERFPDIPPDEFSFYARMALPDLPLARCFDACRDLKTGFTSLLLQDLSKTHEQTAWPLPPPIQMNTLAVQTLATLHGHWWTTDAAKLAQHRPAIHERQRNISAHLDRRLPVFLEDLGDRIAPQRRDLMSTVLKQLPALLTARIESGSPLTLIHGDAHFGNVMLPRDPGQHGCIFIDWEEWAYDFGAVDLAYMMALHWYPDRRARHERNMLRAYFDALPAHATDAWSWEQLLEDYRLAHLRNFIIPVFQHEMGALPSVWWPHIERLFLNFEDLGCAELL